MRRLSLSNLRKIQTFIRCDRHRQVISFKGCRSLNCCVISSKTSPSCKGNLSKRPSILQNSPLLVLNLTSFVPEPNDLIIKIVFMHLIYSWCSTNLLQFFSLLKLFVVVLITRVKWVNLRHNMIKLIPRVLFLLYLSFLIQILDRLINYLFYVNSSYLRWLAVM